MTALIVALLVVLASNLDVLVFVYACTVALIDAALVSAVGMAVWVRLVGSSLGGEQ